MHSKFSLIHNQKAGQAPVKSPLSPSVWPKNQEPHLVRTELEFTALNSCGRLVTAA